MYTVLWPRTVFMCSVLYCHTKSTGASAISQITIESGFRVSFCTE